MKKIFKTFTATGCVILTMAGCSTENKMVKLPEVSEIQTVQYNSMKVPADRLETENLSSLVQDLKSLQPHKNDDVEINELYDTISLIYENGDKDVFLFWKENNSWYAQTLDGTIYENADFVEDYIDRTETDFAQNVTIPNMFWLKFLTTHDDYDDNYDILAELIDCLAQGYSLEQAAEITEDKVRRDETLYQYAISQNFNPTDEELQEYKNKIVDELKAIQNYNNLETIFHESGTNIEKEIEKRDHNIKKELCIQMLYNDRYNSFRRGEDKVGEIVYWDFESYWNAFLEKTVLTQQLSEESDIELQMTRAMEYIISNKETLEKELEIVITL